jgi:hypothetical protein
MSRREELAERFVDLVCTAASRISGQYFQLPVSGLGKAIDRERVYCYELYHQLRVAQAEDLSLHAFQLAGEVDKKGHPEMRGSTILDASKPDLLVHVPGEMKINVLVVEVKPINTRGDLFTKDVEKVAAFVHKANYAAGACLVYGDGSKQLDRLRKIATTAFTPEILAAVRLLHHPTSGERASIISWS